MGEFDDILGSDPEKDLEKDSLGSDNERSYRKLMEVYDRILKRDLEKKKLKDEFRRKYGS